MSDRARSSVRTGTRDGSGTSDGVPEAAGPVDDAGTSSSSTGTRPPEATGTAAPESAATVKQSVARPADPKPADPKPAAVKPADPKPVTKPAAAKPAAAKPAAAKPAGGPAPAAHPVTPLGQSTQTSAAAAGGSRSTAASRPASSANPPVPPTGARPAAGRTATPTDSTQAVPLPQTGARPADPASRPSAARPAESAARGTADAGRSGTGKVRGVGRGPRRARLQLRHIDTWSALKISLVVSIALFFVWMVAVGVLYGVLSGLGVFGTLNDLIGQLGSSSGNEGSGGDVITAGVVFGGAAVIGAVNIVLLTALCTVSAFVYNLCSDLVGGLEVTLAERE